MRKIVLAIVGLSALVTVALTIGLLAWVLFVAPLKGLLPKSVVAFVLRHRPINGMG